jgi:hypothetical protein
MEDSMSYFTEIKLVDKVSGVAAAITAAGELTVKPAAAVSSDNSSQTPLAEDAVFTGDSIDTLGYTTAQIALYADVASAAGGLVVEVSSDETNWYVKHQFSYRNVSEEKDYPVTLTRRYLRVSYTNGAVAQTVFDLSTVLR